MKIYGETIFDISYLLITLIIGLYILIKSKDKLGKLIGSATLILGFGDSFHLVPRILNYFINYDFNSFLGIGKLITSITMTIFYIFMFYIYKDNYKINDKNSELYIWILSLIRIILCLLPQNRWITNDGTLTIGIIRNIPFLFIGFLIIILYYKERKKDKIFKNIWIYVLLSFIFYIPVVIGSTTFPILGMLMLPKTIRYILIILSFNNKIKSNI